MFETPDSIFSECTSSIFYLIDHYKEIMYQPKADELSVKEKRIDNENYKFSVYMSWYQILNEEVHDEVSWEIWENLIEWNKWRRK